MNMRSDELRELEANQTWLAGFQTPAPRADALARTKTLLRQELARREGRWRIGPAKGFWAAAAMLALSAGLIWHASLFSLQMAPQGPTVSQLALATLPVDPDEAELSSLAGDLSEIGSGSSLAVQTPLDGLLDDVQDLEVAVKAPWDS